MKRVKVINLNRYPIATMSGFIGIGAFSSILDFTKFSLNNLFTATGKGLLEFISWYICIKILVWLFGNKHKSHAEN